MRPDDVAVGSRKCQQNAASSGGHRNVSQKFLAQRQRKESEPVLYPPRKPAKSGQICSVSMFLSLHRCDFAASVDLEEARTQLSRLERLSGVTDPPRGEATTSGASSLPDSLHTRAVCRAMDCGCWESGADRRREFAAGTCADQHENEGSQTSSDRAQAPSCVRKDAAFSDQCWGPTFARQQVHNLLHGVGPAAERFLPVREGGRRSQSYVDRSGPALEAKLEEAIANSATFAKKISSHPIRPGVKAAVRIPPDGAAVLPRSVVAQTVVGSRTPTMSKRPKLSERPKSAGRRFVVGRNGDCGSAWQSVLPFDPSCTPPRRCHQRTMHNSSREPSLLSTPRRSPSPEIQAVSDSESVLNTFLRGTKWCRGSVGWEAQVQHLHVGVQKLQAQGTAVVFHEPWM